MPTNPLLFIMMEEDRTPLGLSTKSKNAAQPEETYSFSGFVPVTPTPPAILASPIIRMRSRILRLLWLSFLALIAGCIGVGVLQQDAVGPMISKLGSGISSSSFKSTDELALDQERLLPWDSSLYLRAGATESFAENLQPENQYITSWTYAGWTNDFMAFSNLIYLGMISSRIPILPPFPPSLSHIGKGGKYINYGEVFDLPRLRRSLRTPILEWKDVKQEGSPVVDALGCWSIWAGMTTGGAYMRNALVDHLNLDISYTSIPHTPLVHNSTDPHTSFWDLSSVLFPKGRKAALSLSTTKRFPSPIRDATLEPNEQLACFDIMYFVGARRPFEWEEAYSPAWRFVATHAHWNPTLLTLAETYVRKVFGLDEDDSIPLFITLHVRRGDFVKLCGDNPAETCMPPLAAYARRVQEIRDELRIIRSLAVERVIITSDEQDPAWWDEVRALGWSFIDHEQQGTTSKHGKWYPALIDAVVQSMGIGFVGTARSTMSLVAARRVEDWNGGISRQVSWGRNGADN